MLRKKTIKNMAQPAKLRHYIPPRVEDLTSALGNPLQDTTMIVASDYARGGTLTHERDTEEVEETGEGDGWSAGGLW